MQENEKKKMITDKISELNNRYLVLYGRLHRCGDHIPDEQLDVSLDALLCSYKRELEVILSEDCIVGAEALFILRQKVKLYTPRVGLFGNKLGRAIKKRIKAEHKELLARMKKDATSSALSDPPQTPKPPTDSNAVVPVVRK